MRIASVSKPITATAIMLLVQRDQLSLTDRLFGANALYGFSLAPAPYDANEVAIEVRHLLNHTSGFAPIPSDPADEQPGFDVGSLIGWTLNNRAPVASPGSTFAYLNFGYVALAHVIETVTGQSYEQVVRNELLLPAGITSMAVGGDSAGARQPDEVTYYAAAGDQDPYTVLVTRNAGATGWIATPIDLLRFLRVVDGVGTDILTAASRASMSWPTAANPSYGYGWDLDGPAGTWTHNGALPGSVAFLRLRDDGDGLAAAANTRQPGMQQGPMQNDLATLLDVIRQLLHPPPAFDLFD
jgi:CubicO group peptidase (beta-lactamase class C family)